MNPNLPKIGLSACFQHADPTRSLFTGKTLQYIEQSIAHWLMGAEALVVMIPCPTGDTARHAITLEHYAQWLDGLVLHGGADVWPGSYGEQPIDARWHGDRVRDAYDIALVRAFEREGKPIFGVCRGLQLLNVAYGGTLWQDILTQCDGAHSHREAAVYDQHFHAIDIVPGTRLAQLYPGQPRVRVNSIHHQAVKDLAPGFAVEARSSEDGVVEAIRRTAPGSSYVAATQWHPEFHRPGSDTVDDGAILRDYLAAVEARRALDWPVAQTGV